jgi:hypothetical protein
MRLFQNRALKNIFGPKKEVIKNRVKISLITLTTYGCYSGDTIKDKVSSTDKNINLYMLVVEKPIAMGPLRKTWRGGKLY